MRVLKLGLFSSLAIVAFATALSTEVTAQDGRLIGGGAGITVFEDRNFRGDAETYFNNVPNLPSRFNNRISSVRVGPGEQWQICDQPNYRGQCVTVSGEESDLGRNRWDNRISSMRRISGGNQGGGPGWGNPQGGAVRPPNWAQGTFYGVAPDGSQISLTIAQNGSVTANVNGGMSYGIYTRGNVLNIGGARSRVTRQGNGILTTRTDNGERIAYSRTSGGNTGGPGWGGGGGNQVAPPSWARGRFVGRAPDGTQIVLTIANNGSVTANVGGGLSYGSYTSGNFININGATSRVTSVNRGIRTTRTDNGEVITYRRQ